ncbi:hypothetical protein [Gordonia otitidis]|uniref:DUF1648 domain-containing protein n=1 Tax=Gordonia otitidis (strain DSM 44809 / CCUG 52243 / JCM 12355 / NBRC 100426 / IFM 10032) TaxID=1108044 RepID=H5TMM3_GORO1|nr:hypothetical protein [Gordonia otitidis]GAB34731.1 hypothetical protein GOOTI_121_00120 [Gordonia otitidis NBRC 100426]
MNGSSAHHPRRAGYALLGSLPSVVVLVVGLVLLSLWRSELPTTVATHWGSGGVDSTADVRTVVVSVVIVAVVAALVGGLSGWFIREARVLRVAIALVNGVVVFVTIGLVGTVGAQRGSTDTSDVGVPVGALLLAGVLGLLVALASASLVRPTHLSQPPVVGAQPIESLAVGERFLWQRRVSASSGSLVVLGVALLTMGALAVVLRSAWLVLPCVVVVAAAAILWSARVSVDRGGVAVRGVVGWPRLTIPMHDVRRAEVAHVNALRDFGGYGQRICVYGRLRGVRGLVLRSGSGLLITRSDGSRDLVVVPDAAVAAVLVNASVSQAHSRR